MFIFVSDHIYQVVVFTYPSNNTSNTTRDVVIQMGEYIKQITKPGFPDKMAP